MHARQPRRDAFTLMEILIVVLLLGILAAMVMPRFVEVGDEVRENAIKTDLRTVRQQIEIYRFRNSTFPPDIQALVDDGYLPKVPLHPNPGSYTYVAGSGSFTSSVDPTW